VAAPEYVPVMSTHPQPPVVRVLLALVCACGPTAVSAAATDPTLPLPEEWASALICGCEEAANFTAGRTPTRARFEFSAYELSTTDRVRVAGKSLRWHFCAASGEQTWARVAWRRSVAEPLDAISVHVKNPNAHPLNLHLEMLDADGVWYLSPPQSLGEERNWRQLSFRLADFATAPGDADPRPGVDFPVIWIAAVGPWMAAAGRGCGGGKRPLAGAGQVCAATVLAHAEADRPGQEAAGACDRWRQARDAHRDH